MSCYRVIMVPVRLNLLPFIIALLVLPLGDSLAQELYGDESNLDQYSPLLGENFINYPVLEEYGYPEVEEFPDEDPYEDDEEPEEDDNSGREDQKSKKETISAKDNEHAQKPSLSDERKKRQAPLQDDPVVLAREKLQRAIKAAQALSGLENQLGLNPSTIENKTAKLETQLKDEQRKFKTLADETEDSGKRQKFFKLEKTADEDVGEAESILKFIVKLEAAKYLAKERARESLEAAERNKINAPPTVYLGTPLSFPAQTAPFVGVPQASYHPAMPSYTAPYQPQMFQGMSAPSLASPPSAVSHFSPGGIVPATQGISTFNSQQANNFAPPPKSSTQQTVEQVRPQPAQVAAYSSEQGKLDTSMENFQNDELPSQTTAQKPAVVQPPVVPINDDLAPKPQFVVHAKANTELKTPPAQAPPKPPQIDKSAGQAVPSPAKQLVAPPSASPPAQPMATASAQMFPPATGQPYAPMSQAAPLTASYTPSVVSPNPAPMSGYFDSPPNSNGPFDAQAFYRPLTNPPQAQQFVIPPNQPKKAASKRPEPVNPAVAPYAAAYNDQPQISVPANAAAPQPPSPAAYSNQQALASPYPSNPYYSWNTQTPPSSVPQNPWSPSMYYPAPAPAPYQTPVNPLMTDEYSKLHATERANLAMTKIEEAVGLSPNAVKNIIDVIEKQAKDEASHYEQDTSKERKEINKEKEILQNDEPAKSEEAKKIIKDDEAKMRSDIQKENNAKQEVSKIKKIEKILTIIEAAKYSAMQRAKKRLQNVGGNEEFDGGDIRKRDLEDLENDLRKRRRNEINIWLKGSRNRIDTSHFLRKRGGRLVRHREESERWGLDNKEPSQHLQVDDHNSVKTNQTRVQSTESRLGKLKLFKTLTSSGKLDSGKRFSVQRRTDVPKTKDSANGFVMAKMLQKMDKMFQVQGEILKYLKAEHDLTAKKHSPKRWKRSLHNSGHHKKAHKDVKRKKRKAN